MFNSQIYPRNTTNGKQRATNREQRAIPIPRLGITSCNSSRFGEPWDPGLKIETLQIWQRRLSGRECLSISSLSFLANYWKWQTAKAQPRETYSSIRIWVRAAASLSLYSQHYRCRHCHRRAVLNETSTLRNITIWRILFVRHCAC